MSSQVLSGDEISMDGITLFNARPTRQREVIVDELAARRSSQDVVVKGYNRMKTKWAIIIACVIILIATVVVLVYIFAIKPAETKTEPPSGASADKP